MVGVVLEVNGERMVVVSVYMPTGLDFAGTGADVGDGGSDTGPEQLYSQLIRWCGDGDDYAVILGDFNETMAAVDRADRSAGSRFGQWISAVPDAGFTDAYRTLHGLSDIGYTHSAPSVRGRLSRARLDYVFLRGWQDSALKTCQVDDQLVVSNHRLLWAQVEAALPLEVTVRPVRLRVPNLRNASGTRKAKLVARMDRDFGASIDRLEQLSQGDRSSVDEMVDTMSGLAFAAARDCLGMTGGRPFASKQLRRLDRMRRYLASARALAASVRAMGGGRLFRSSRKWCILYRRAGETLC